MKIQAPEGYEIDKENSTFECIKFKPIKKVLSYEDVAKDLFENKNGYYTSKNGEISSTRLNGENYSDSNNCTSEKQAKKLLAINKLMNVAKYLNAKEPKSEFDTRYYIRIIHGRLTIRCTCPKATNCGAIYFTSEKLAEQAIKILGEETIRIALSTNW